VRAPLSNHVTQNLPLFRVNADRGTHPPVRIDRPVCVIGRKDYVNLPLPAKEVSKLHALIVREQGRVYLRDLASTNGVEVNGEPVREIGLSDADVVRIGSFTLQCLRGFGRNGKRSADGDGDGNGESAAGRGAAAPTAELRGKAGNFSFPPGRHTLLIGQRETCEVRLKHPSVAPVHAVVFEMDGRHYVQTFAPELATRVNGRPIHREVLQPGDDLRIGELAFKYALVDLSAESVAPSGAAASSSGTGTGDSLITPVLDSSIAPAIDPSHHGELEPEESADVAFDVVDAEHESMITPAMDSSVAPAMESGAPAVEAEAPVAAEADEEDYGLDIEPIDDALADAAARGDDSAPKRPAEPPLELEPAPKSIQEPVIEPVVERAMESGIAAAIDPMKPAAAAGAAAAAAAAAASAGAAAAAAASIAKSKGRDDPAKSIQGDEDDGDIPAFDLEPMDSSADLDPIALDAEPEPHADAAADEAFRANWNAAVTKDQGKLSATYDEDNELEAVIELTPKTDEGVLSASFDDDDGMMSLSEPADDGGLLGDDDIALAAEDESPLEMAPAPVGELRGDDSNAPQGAIVVGEAEAEPADSAAAAAADASADQAAKLAELAKAAGLGDRGRGGESTSDSDVTAEEITALVQEVAERSQELKAAWSAFQSENGDASAASPPPPPPPPPPAGNGNSRSAQSNRPSKAPPA